MTPRKILGLDVSKSSVTYWILSELPNDPKRFARTLRQQKLEATPEGRAKLLSLDFDLAVLEPTGVYSRVWRHWLRQANRPYRLVGHAQLKNYRDSWNLQKTDKLDGLAMAMYGIDRGDRPSAWLTERDYELSDLVAYLSHLNRQKNGYQNNLRQKLIWQVPEWADREMKRAWGSDCVPGLLRAIAGDATPKWEKELSASCGTGLNSQAAGLARILIQIEQEEIEAERQIDLELAKPQYAPYLATAERCEYSRWLTVSLIAGIYPFEQFLDNGRPRMVRSLSKVKGLPVKKDESLRAFKLACGMGQIFVQSGDYEGWVAGGSGEIRQTLHNSITAAYLADRRRVKAGEEPDPLFVNLKSSYDKQGVMKVARRWVEKFYRELLKQHPWGINSSLDTSQESSAQENLELV
jgi:transposase